jgi:hypothetical protein
MSDGQLWMTDLSNRDRLASDERFDRRFSGDRKELVEGDARTDHDHATEAPRNCGLTVADGTSSIQDRSFPAVFGWGEENGSAAGQCVVLQSVNVCELNVCKAKGITFSGPPRRNAQSADAAMFLDLEIQHEQASRRIARL